MPVQGPPDRRDGHERRSQVTESLDEDEHPDEDVEAAWADEIQRRLAEVDNGVVEPIPGPEARRRILAAAAGRRETLASACDSMISPSMPPARAHAAPCNRSERTPLRVPGRGGPAPFRAVRTTSSPFGPLDGNAVPSWPLAPSG
ncbi:MAG: addiction module protein [Byssovorax sp.]